jgi:hypothetical protein
MTVGSQKAGEFMVQLYVECGHPMRPVSGAG